MGWNKEWRPDADYFPLTTENPTPGGVVDTGKLTCVDLCIADGNDEVTLDAGDSRPFARRLWYDGSAQVSIRLVANEITATGAGRIAVVFRTTVAGSDTDSGDGGIEVAIPFTATGPAKTAWFTINAGAQADVLFEVVGRDADGTEKVRGVHIQFLNGAVDLCSDGGCPMPTDLYNGEDFSTYADEADFLNTAENNLKNLYNVWYGDDGSVEGCSFAPGVTFCGNPVVRGRWKATASGSNIWDIVGYGSWTRFANPLIDDGGSGGGQLVRFRSVWATMRFKIESGWSADDGVGLLISELHDDGNGINGSCRVYLKAGRVVVVSQADASATLQTTDIGPASMIVGTPGFVEVTTHGLVTDQGGGVWRVMFEVFVNPACSSGTPGSGDIWTATPQDTYTADVVPTPIGGGVNALGFYTWDKFNPTSDTAQWPEKYIDVAQVFYSGSLT